MVRDAIDGPGRIAIIQPHRLDDDNQAPLYSVGCVGELVSIEELEDGRFNIMLLGSNRFRLIREIDADVSYRRAEVDITGSKTTSRQRCHLANARRSRARRVGSATRWASQWTGRP